MLPNVPVIMPGISDTRSESDSESEEDESITRRSVIIDEEDDIMDIEKTRTSEVLEEPVFFLFRNFCQ